MITFFRGHIVPLFFYRMIAQKPLFYAGAFTRKSSAAGVFCPRADSA
jgi:hypothetical protein